MNPGSDRLDTSALWADATQRGAQGLLPGWGSINICQREPTGDNKSQMVGLASAQKRGPLPLWKRPEQAAVGSSHAPNKDRSIPGWSGREKSPLWDSIHCLPRNCQGVLQASLWFPRSSPLPRQPPPSNHLNPSHEARLHGSRPPRVLSPHIISRH